LVNIPIIYCLSGALKYLRIEIQIIMNEKTKRMILKTLIQSRIGKLSFITRIAVMAENLSGPSTFSQLMHKIMNGNMQHGEILLN
jgi:hypothetical protein